VATDPTPDPAPAFQRRTLAKASPWPFAGMAGMACVLFIYAFSGLLAPWWYVVFLLLVWLALFVLAIRWFTLHPKRVVVLQLVALVLWFTLVNLGSAVFGFTA
jgi:hypothetical protein